MALLPLPALMVPVLFGVMGFVTGTAGLPCGLPGLPYISLPARVRLSKAEEQA